ncbi:hypothetical protein [Microbispora amethystogenes]|uniref:hypothetical protein n=1 Tax=Microbispora amethystogenes TaxID=1427754 RepID=UPI001954AA04|nr:hypothetical protein [Microbispora amethystogenes]
MAELLDDLRPLFARTSVWRQAGKYVRGGLGKRASGDQTSYLRNSVVVQNGSTLRTITGGNTCKETDSGTGFWDRYAKTPVGDGAQY